MEGEKKNKKRGETKNKKKNKQIIKENVCKRESAVFILILFFFNNTNITKKKIAQSVIFSIF